MWVCYIHGMVLNTYKVCTQLSRDSRDKAIRDGMKIRRDFPGYGSYPTRTILQLKHIGNEPGSNLTSCVTTVLSVPTRDFPESCQNIPHFSAQDSVPVHEGTSAGSEPRQARLFKSQRALLGASSPRISSFVDRYRVLRRKTRKVRLSTLWEQVSWNAQDSYYTNRSIMYVL